MSPVDPLGLLPKVIEIKTFNFDAFHDKPRRFGFGQAKPKEDIDQIATIFPIKDVPPEVELDE